MVIELVPMVYHLSDLIFKLSQLVFPLICSSGLFPFICSTFIVQRWCIVLAWHSHIADLLRWMLFVWGPMVKVVSKGRCCSYI